MGSQTIDDQFVPERIGEPSAADQHAAARVPRNRALIVGALVVTVASLLGGMLGYDAWQNRAGDGYLGGIPSAPEAAWSIPLKDGLVSLGAPIEVGDDALLLDSGQWLRLISLDDGQEAWTHELPGWVGTRFAGSVRFSSPDGAVLGYASGSRLVMLDPATGQVEQDVTLGSGADRIQDVAARDGALYVGLIRDRSRALLKLDADRPGEEAIWTLSGIPEEQPAPDPGAGVWQDRVCATTDTVVYGPEVWSGTSGFGFAYWGGPAMRDSCWIDEDYQRAVSIESDGQDTTVVIVGGGDDPSAMTPRAVQVVDAGTGRAVSWMDPQDVKARYLVGNGLVLRLRPAPELGDLMLLDGDGTELWQEEASGMEAAVGPWGVAVSGYGEVNFLDLDTGEERWSVPRLVHVMAATRLGPVLASSHTEFAWYDAATGKELFAMESNEYVDAVLGESRRQVFIHTSTLDGTGSVVRAYDAGGRQVWEHPVPDDHVILAHGEALLQSDGRTLSRLR